VGPPLSLIALLPSMRFDTFSALTAINRRWPVEYGKVVQMLLAISFGPRRGGFAVLNHYSEGVDLELIRGADKFAVEVKTTEGDSFTLSEKDIVGLQAKYQTDSYSPAVAALRLQRSADWVIGHALKLVTGSYTCDRLALDSIIELEGIAKIQFERAVAELEQGVLRPPTGAPLDFLASVLRDESR
jgi:Holliday junction resolvase